MSDPSDYTIGWICAIATEYVAAQAFLDEAHDAPDFLSPHDNNNYALGRIGKHNVVIAVLPDGEYGLSSAAVVARDLLHSFPNVRVGLMVGVGGGAPNSEHDIRLGDVVVSSPRDGNGGVFQYDFGKSIQGQRFLTTGFLNQPPGSLRAAVSGLKADMEMNGNNLDEMVDHALANKPRLRRKYGRQPAESDRLFRSDVVFDSSSPAESSDPEMLVLRPDRTDDEDNPAIHYGLIASANQLMKDAGIRDKLAVERGVLCFEMEAAGLMNHFPCLVIRGICDYSDSHKNKSWQGYAAMTAAAYAKALVCRVQQTSLARERKISEVISLIEDVNEEVSGLKRRADLDVLNTLSIAKGAQHHDYHNQHEPRCHPGTRVDLLRGIQDWARDGDDRRIYWLNGMAGTGKSTISRTLAETFAGLGILGGSFFFKRGEVDRSRGALLFTTLAIQLSRHRPELQPFMIDAINQTDNISSRSIAEQFEQLVLSPLESTKHQSNEAPSSILIIDALDECSADTDVLTFIHLLSVLARSKAARIKVFVTSRPELTIQYAFDPIEGRYQEIILQEVTQKVIAQDIRTFLTDELGRIRDEWNSRHRKEPSRRIAPNWPSQEQFETLARLAEPLFIFAATSCRFLRDRAFGNPVEQLETLIKTADSGIHGRLGQTYLPALRQFGDNRPGPEREKLLKRFRQVVGTILLIEEPLSSTSIARLVGLEETKVYQILTMLRSVIDFSETTPDSPVRIFHLSFRDFLLGEEAEDFAIDYRTTHRRIALHCIDLLSEREPLGYNMCGLYPGADRADVEEQAIRSRFPPHVKYACLHWIHHAERAQLQLRSDGKVHRFLKTHLLHWLESLSLLGEAPAAAALPNKLPSLVKRPEGGLVEFLKDSEWFISRNISTFSRFPLQIYWSALVFSPTTSVIKKVFAAAIPKCISFQIGEELSWDPIKMILEPDAAHHFPELCSVAVSPDSKVVACGYFDGTVTLWALTTGDILFNFRLDSSKPDNEIHSIAFSRDSRLVVAASFTVSGAYKVGTAAAVWHNQGQRILHTAASRDQDIFASAHPGGSVSLWSVTTGRHLRSLFKPQNEPKSSQGLGETEQGFVSFSTDSRVVVASFHQLVLMWDTTTGQCLHALMAPRVVICPPVSLTGTDSLLVTMEEGRKIQVTNVLTGECISECCPKYEMDRFSRQVVVSNNARYIAFNNNCYFQYGPSEGDRGVSICRLGDPVLNVSIHKPPWDLFSHDTAFLSFSQDEELLVQATSSQVFVWSTSMLLKLQNGGAETYPERTLSTDAAMCSYQSSRDERLFVSSYENGDVTIWSSSTGQPIRSHKATRLLPGDIPGILSSDWKHVVESTDQGITRIWAAQELEHAVELRPPLPIHFEKDTGQFGINISPDLRFLTISQHYETNLWCVKERRSAWRGTHPRFQVPLVNFTPDSKTVVLGSMSTVTIRSLETNVAVDIPLRGTILAQAVSPDSAWISAQHAADGRRSRTRLSLWSPDGRLHAEKSWDSSGLICGLAFSPRSDKISALGWGAETGEMEIRAWSIPGGHCIAIWSPESEVVSDSLERNLFSKHGSANFFFGFCFLMSNKSWIFTELGQVLLPTGDDRAAPGEAGFHGIGLGTEWITWNGDKLLRLPPGKCTQRNRGGLRPVRAVGDHSVAWVSMSKTFCALGFHPGIPPI